MVRSKRAYTCSLRQKATELAKEIQRKGQTIYQNEVITSLCALARKLDIKSPATLHGWLQKDWSKDASEKRLKRRGRKRTLRREDEEELLEWIIDRNKKGDPVNGEEISRYCADNFDWELKRAWVSKYAKRNRLGSHLTQKRPAKRDRESSAIEIEDFRHEINDETA